MFHLRFFMYNVGMITFEYVNFMTIVYVLNMAFVQPCSQLILGINTYKTHRCVQIQ